MECRRRLVGLLLPAALALIAIAAVACGGAEYDEGPLGAVKVGPGEDIQVRAMLGLTGDPNVGVTSQRGVMMAIADYGPVHGRSVSAGDTLDSGCDADAARVAAETVVSDPRVVGVIGTTCSVGATAAMPAISQAGMVMIAPSTTAPSLTSDLRGNAGPGNRPGYYRTSNNDLHQAIAVAQFAYRELGLRRVGVVHDGDPYTSGLAGAFAEAFEEIGGAAAVASVPKGAADVTGALAAVAAISPDGLFLPLFTAEGAAVVRQKDQVQGLRDVTVIAGAALLVTDFLSLPESAGLYFAGPELDFAGNTNEATGVDGGALDEAYRSRFGEAPTSVYLAHTYDAVTLLLRAIDSVAETVGEDLYIDRAKLREALSAVSGFQGIIGPITCDEFGDCGAGRQRVRHHTDPSVTDVAEIPIVYRFEP